MRTVIFVLLILLAPLYSFVGTVNHESELRNIPEWATSISSTDLVNVSISNSVGHHLTAGYWHACSASNDSDKLTCWGKNTAGQLGIGTTGALNTPIESLSMNGGIIDFDTGTSAGYKGFTCAVNTLNELYCWGDNRKGQLGIGDDTPSTTPARVYLGSNLGAAKVSTGYEHACAVATDGTVMCWGWGNDARLGNGQNMDRTLPTQTSSLGQGRVAVDVSTSWIHSCALLDDGSVVCWGDGGSGKLGNGGTQTKFSPTPVTGFGPTNPVKQISAGYYHTCALLVNGSVSCWGSNSYGELGREGTSGINTQPALVAGLQNKNIVHIDAGHYASCAVADSGEAFCWGYNDDGQLGDGTQTSQSQPVGVMSLGFNRKAISVSTTTDYYTHLRAHETAPLIE